MRIFPLLPMLITVAACDMQNKEDTGGSGTSATTTDTGSDGSLGGDAGGDDACPKCGEAMALRTVVLPPATLRVLASLGRSARGPP